MLVELGIFHLSLSSIINFLKNLLDNFNSGKWSTELHELAFEARSARDDAW